MRWRPTFPPPTAAAPARAVWTHVLLRLSLRRVDSTPRRCISYLTIEQRGAVPEELREKMGRHLFGCDICQDVCPWNRRAPASPDPAFAPRTELVNPSLEWISGMKVEEFWRYLSRLAGETRRNSRGLLRNAAIAMGNSGERKHLPRLRELAQHADPAIAEHARWAIARLEATPDADRTP